MGLSAMTMVTSDAFIFDVQRVITKPGLHAVPLWIYNELLPRAIYTTVRVMAIRFGRLRSVNLQ